MATIKILSVKNGEVIQNIDNNIVKLTQNSVIQISANIDEVATITRQGNFSKRSLLLILEHTGAYWICWRVLQLKC